MRGSILSRRILAGTPAGDGRKRFPTIASLPFAAAGMLAQAGPAFAHASDRGHVLLLPTGYYMAGGAIAVAASFLLLGLLRGDRLDRLGSRPLPLRAPAEGARILTSLLAFLVFAALLAAGLWGSSDPLSNPLPLTIWTLIWGWLVIIQALLGDIWSWINPWYGPYRLARAIGIGRSDTPSDGRRSHGWAAVVLFFGFAWFELVDAAPDDPGRLAVAAALYWLVSFVATLAFGYKDWSKRGEFLGLFLSMLSRFSIIGEKDGRLDLCWPGAKLLRAEPLSLSGVAFLLLALSSVSFDGFARTFFWLGLNGINPLEFPGRTALIGLGTEGLLLSFVVLASLFGLAVWLGERLAGARIGTAAAAGLLVWSIVPIALAYHFAHYLTDMLVSGQYALVALSDPFALGWNLFGTANMQVRAGVVAGAQSAWWLWNVQSGAIIAGHVIAVLVAHGLAWRLHRQQRRAMMSQLPLAVLMVAYTLFGLWLLATPTAG